jgi:hydrogenase nickel incorporation protein HypA/HybF
MHELAVCQALIEQVQHVAAEHGAEHVCEIVVTIGPLSGVEPELLQQAYTIARSGTVADSAALVMEIAALRVHCADCNKESDVNPTRMICKHCGNWRTTLVSGDELLLARVELERPSGLH